MNIASVDELPEIAVFFGDNGGDLIGHTLAID
jgi:hypothetical protein